MASPWPQRSQGRSGAEYSSTSALPLGTVEERRQDFKINPALKKVRKGEWGQSKHVTLATAFAMGRNGAVAAGRV
jgi:hypothetical protein